MTNYFVGPIIIPSTPNATVIVPENDKSQGKRANATFKLFPAKTARIRKKKIREEVGTEMGNNASNILSTVVQFPVGNADDESKHRTTGKSREVHTEKKTSRGRMQGY